MTPMSPASFDPLTVDVLRALAEGLSDGEVAKRVHVSARTVQRVVDAFKADTGSRTRIAAGVAACRLGLLGDPVADTERDHGVSRRWADSFVA